MKKIYVGNFSFSLTESELRSLFEAHGSIESVANAANGLPYVITPDLRTLNWLRNRPTGGQIQLVWDHIQERKHHGTAELPRLQ